MKGHPERLELPYFSMWKEGEILCARYVDDLYLTIEMAKEIVTTRLAYSEGKSYACLIDMKGITGATKEVREYMAREGAELIKAGALIVGSPLNRMIGNIFLSVNKPAVPTKLFTDEVKARKWLKRYL